MTVPSPIKFEEWISSELGSDIPKLIKKNPYINFGRTKFIIEYLFNNLYSPKYAKLVTLNLMHDGSSSQNLFNTGDGEMTRLKIKNYELDKKLEEARSQLEREDQEIDQVLKNLSDMENACETTNEVVHKKCETILQEAFIKKTQDVIAKVEKATQKLDNVSSLSAPNSSNNNNNQLMKNQYFAELERFMHNFQSDTSKASSSTISTLLTSGKLNWHEFTQYLNELICKQIDEIKESNSNAVILNDIELIKYQMQDLITTNGFDDTALTMADSLNDLYLEFIQKACQITRLKEDNASVLTTSINEVKLKINQFLQKEYQSNFRVYGRYLKSYLELKMAESNLKESNRFLDELERELTFYRQLLIAIQQKYDKLNALHTQVHDKYAHLIRELKVSRDVIMPRIESSRIEIQSCTCLLFDLIGNLNLARNTDHIAVILQKNYAQFRAMYQTTAMAKTKNLHQLMLPNTIERCIVFRESCMTPSVLLERFLELYLRMKHNLKSKSTNVGALALIETMQTVHDTLDKLLTQCRKVDETELMKYVELLQQCRTKCEREYKNFAEKEKFIEIWWSQPGVYKYKLDNYTVNGGRTLDYYLSAIEQAIDIYRRKHLY